MLRSSGLQKTKQYTYVPPRSWYPPPTKLRHSDITQKPEHESSPNENVGMRTTVVYAFQIDTFREITRV
jgi:hypothetical protein